jgi:asparagine synthase (glutamine-hydrolysing)
MCGINGIALSTKTGRSIDIDRLVRMRDVLTHRGPDEEGIFLSGRIGLGHRRLSIVDVASGRQPMSNEDGSLHITYNGEIYNHMDFRHSLEEKGHVYRTHCDTETILHLYEEMGAACVDYLRGMFAFAIWDQRKQELFIARDRLGVKPLYYVHAPDGSLFFASEIKALLVADAVKPEINFPAIPDYLANHATSGEETLFRDVRRLLPGHILKWRDGSLEITKYWDLDSSARSEDANGQNLKSDDDYIAEWSELFRNSVRLRLMADVPLGMFLSGGIDSSAIAAVMSDMVAEPIKTFSVAFAEREANELSYARLVAEAYKTDHHEVIVSPTDFFAALPQLIWHEDEPLAHPSSVPLYFVSQLAARHVKVVLTGEGSDESLGGYERYRKTIYNIAFGKRYRDLTTESARRAVRQVIQQASRVSTIGRKLQRSFLYLSPELEAIYFDNFSVFSQSMQQELLTPEAKERMGIIYPYREMTKYFNDSVDSSLLGRLLYTDTKTYLHELLMKQDQMSMAASVESRVPFLDHKLMEFSARLPDRMKVRGFTTKYILRKSMEGILPEPILKRRKMGFPVPIGKWFRGEFRSIVDEYVLGARASERGVFDQTFVRRLVEQHQFGRANHSERLWALVNFEIWQRQFIDGENYSQLQPTISEKQLSSHSHNLEATSADYGCHRR